MKTLKTLTLALLITLTIACQNKKSNMNTQTTNDTIPEAWEEMCNAPQGYPIEVYEGGLLRINEDGEVINSRNLSGYGLSTGFYGWGSSGGGMSRNKFVPTHINCIWLSYAEGVFYYIDSPIDYNKMLKLFQEGYPNSLAFLNYGERKKSYYNSIITGFAPDGVVVIWLAGSGRLVEIGRYKGQKYVVDPEEIASLEQEKHVLFEKWFRDGIMVDPNVIPIEVQKANVGKPIPYGLWDSYRTKYSWRPVFEVQQEGVMRSAYMEMINGEKEKLFDIALKENKYKKRARPIMVDFGWYDNKKKGFAAEIIFNEQEIKTAFEELYKENKDIEADLVFTVNHSNNFVTILLKSKDKEIRLTKTKVNMY